MHEADQVLNPRETGGLDGYAFHYQVIGRWSCLGAFSISATAHAGGHGITPQEKKLIPGAKAEGSVTLINPLFSDRTSKRIGAAFKKKYGLGDGFKVNMLRKGTGATVAQVRQEIKAGKFTVGRHSRECATIL